MYKFSNGFVGTVGAYALDRLEDIEKVQVNNNLDNGYKRRTFNQKDHREQLEYITKLFKKKIYNVYFTDGTIVTILKRDYDALMDIWTDKKLFKAEEIFVHENKYDSDYETAARAWLR